jgi:oligopeptide transport system substrate-binding protein
VTLVALLALKSVRRMARGGTHFPGMAATLGICAMLVLLVGCDRAMDRADLVFMNGAEPEPLDPAVINAQASARVAYALFEGLTAFDQTGKPQPGVAESWTISPDARTYTFRLRRNAVWSNGDPVTAHDFFYSWRRTLSPETGAEYVSQLQVIRNARAFTDGEIKDFREVGIRVLDPFTLEVTLENPTPYFLDLCAFATLLPVHAPTVEKYSDWATNPRHFMGNGPFTLVEWRLFDRLRLLKNPRYWNAAQVGMASIDVLPSARANTAFNFYSTGLSDLMMDKGLAPTSLMDQLRVRPDFHAAQFLGNYFVRFNVKRKPFDDARVRLAFALVIDKALLCEKITRAGEQPAQSLTPPGTGGTYVAPPGLTRNPERARQLLAEAGYPNGRGVPLVGYLYKGDSDLDRDIAVELQGMFDRELGVKMLLQPQEWTVYLNSQSNLDYDLCRSSWVGDYNDPQTFLGMFITGDGNNRTGWSNRAYDGLIADAAREANPATRFAIFAKAEQILISEEVPICPLYYYVGIQFYDDERLGGIESNLLDEHPLKHIFWKKR